MKLLFLPLILAAFSLTASATTVIADGGITGYQFGFSTTSDVLGFTPFTSSGQSVATITVGSMQGGVFNAFATSDATPPRFGEVGDLTGRWLGSAGDNSSAADAFNGQQVWFAITTTVGGQTYTGYFADMGTLFPTNAGGAGDDQLVLSNNLDTVAAASTGNWTIDQANQRVTLVIPEPSTALAGALGALLLLRRKR